MISSFVFALSAIIAAAMAWAIGAQGIEFHEGRWFWQ